MSNERDTLYRTIQAADECFVELTLDRSVFKTEHDWRMACSALKSALNQARYEERMRAIRDGAR